MSQFFECFKNLFAHFVEIEKFRLYCWNAKLAEGGELKLRMSRGEECDIDICSTISSSCLKVYTRKYISRNFVQNYFRVSSKVICNFFANSTSKE